MVDHAPFFDVNRQVVLKVLNSCRIFVNQGAQALLFTGNIPRGVFCERRSQKTRDILREFMRVA
ncbi:hypothetical protein DW955_16185 [Ruminococcus sp. AM45-9BH]|jgi:hypothetical protein|nr:hypothetical protein DW225_12890 [Ruminococcus sp. AM18-44]RHO22564.1 hypothetical protein DW217_13835 [Ruminococcus sp. AM18-15]RHS59844.1 hypothetical protein DW955_16185 [Ruminococcus sp. AM45-9BH]RHS70616.1 hypothetical protein DW953_17460 [Ruminococcus sp. AM45-2]RHT68548.1 hypothetical protein DW759_11460 [Ruminococcus sp. AM29-12LB]RHU45848.1 hypothetical protein DXD14_14315 [Ruminococcus sp. TF11-2AC]